MEVTWVCCFCGEPMDGTAGLRVEVRILGGEGNQGLRAHPGCLRERLAPGTPSLPDLDRDEADGTVPPAVAQEGTPGGSPPKGMGSGDRREAT